MLPRPHGRGGNGHLEGNIFFFISVYNGLVQVNSGGCGQLSSCGCFCPQLLPADLPPYVRCSAGGPFPVSARGFKAAVAAYLAWMAAGREEGGKSEGSVGACFYRPASSRRRFCWLSHRQGGDGAIMVVYITLPGQLGMLDVGGGIGVLVVAGVKVTFKVHLKLAENVIGVEGKADAFCVSFINSLILGFLKNFLAGLFKGILNSFIAGLFNGLFNSDLLFNVLPNRFFCGLFNGLFNSFIALLNNGPLFNCLLFNILNSS